MARVVSPWTWNKKIRDHGPNDRDFLCAMLVLHTFMDTRGFTFVGLRRWAEAARMAVNTLRKHRQKAIDLNWLHADSIGGARAERFKSEYRCTVPDVIELSEKDLKLAEHVASECGELDESVSTHIDTDDVGGGVMAVASASKSVSTHIDTDSREPLSVRATKDKSSRDAAAVDASVSKHATDTEHLCQPASDLCQQKTNLYQTDSPSVSPRLIRKGSLEGYSEVSIEVSSEEGAARSSTVERHRDFEYINSNPFKSPLAESRKVSNQDFEAINNKIEKLAVMTSLGGNDLNLSDTSHIANMTGCTQSQVVIAIKQLKDRGRLPVVRKQRAVS